MRTGALMIVVVLLAGCVSSPPSCDRRLTPINALLATGERPRVGSREH